MATRPRIFPGEHYFESLAQRGLHVGRFIHRSTISPHDHLFHELVFVESGQAMHEGVDGRRRVGRGDVIVLRPGIWHAYRKPDELRIINCLIQPQLLFRLTGLLDEMTSAFELLRKPATVDDPPTIMATAGTEEGRMISQALESIIIEQRNASEGFGAANVASLLQILVATVRVYNRVRGPQPPTPITRADEAVVQAIDYLQRHYHTPISLNELAERVLLSPAHLSRSFSKSVGMGLVQFIHRLRAEEACRLLATSGLQVGQIATRVGYEEVAYFSRCFKQQIGVSPRQYRSRNAVNAPDAS